MSETNDNDPVDVTHDDTVLDNSPETFKRLVDEANEYKDKYLRVVAEMENTKKRVERDRLQAIKFANEKIAFDLLETLDNFDLMLTLDIPKTVKQGIELTYGVLKTTLARHKVTECRTDVFDPNYHEAVSFVVGDAANNSISQVLRKGYMFDDRLLRPATVVVVKNEETV